MERCECELFIEKYFGLNTLNTTEKTEIKTDFGQIVNALVMFSEERAEANVGTSEKDLWVCSINGSYLDGLLSGITACNAEFRVIMQNIYSELNNLSRINKSDMKRALYNHSSCELGEALNPNMHEDSGG